jgi:tetratricopeptide (TPR) repeat protein
MAIASLLAERDPGSARTRVDLAFSSAHLADVIQDEEPQRSLRLYRDSIRMFDDIVSTSPANISFRQWQARRYEGIAMVLEAQGDLREALRMFERALEIRSALAASEPSRRELNGELSAAACSVARVMHKIGDSGQRAAMDIAVQHAAKLESERNALATHHQLAECYETFGDAVAADDPAMANRWYEKARQSWNLWRQADPANAFAKGRLARLERSLAATRASQ